MAQDPDVWLRKYIKLLPVVFMALACMQTIYPLMLPLSEVRYYGSVAITIISLVSFFLLRRYYNYILTAGLLIALINPVAFVSVDGNFSLRKDTIELSFQLFPFCMLVLVVVLNWDSIRRIMHAYAQANADAAAAQRLSAMEKYQLKYEAYSTEQLALIVQENVFVPEAVEAARQLLKKRENEQVSSS